METDGEVAQSLFRAMIRIRRFEEAVARMHGAGELPGAVHLCIGQEAVAAGVCSVLGTRDTITSNHRGHGHILAKGGDMGRCLAELLGRADGYCRGKGGSMHLADLGLGIIGANGIVGAGLPLATGAALAAQVRGSGEVSVCFFGDGASNEGTFHEALNLSALWSLPVVFVCESNGWGELTRTERVTSGHGIAERANAYGIPGVTIDGNDALAVREVAVDAVARARSGKGPTLIEAKTFRIHDHSEGLDLVAGKTQKDDELAAWRAKDPITRLYDRLLRDGGDPAMLEALDTAAQAEVDAGLAFAQASLPPAAEIAFEDMFFDAPLAAREA